MFYLNKYGTIDWENYVEFMNKILMGPDYIIKKPLERTVCWVHGSGYHIYYHNILADDFFHVKENPMGRSYILA